MVEGQCATTPATNLPRMRAAETPDDVQFTALQRFDHRGCRAKTTDHHDRHLRHRTHRGGSAH
jgi:hypothetical protein